MADYGRHGDTTWGEVRAILREVSASQRELAASQREHHQQAGLPAAPVRRSPAGGERAGMIAEGAC